MNLFKIPEFLYEEIQLGTTVIVFIILLFIINNFFFFSEVYKNQAVDYQEKKEVVKAEQNYLKAIELDSDNLDAHFKLGTLYEDLQDINQAKKHYLIAAKGGLLEAYNNLAYWYLREGKDAEAVELLETGIKFLAKKDENLEQLSEGEFDISQKLVQIVR
jgi:tetratricopeptide (TPR) repeat protein